MTYMILGEENVGGIRVLRKLAVTDDPELAESMFNALVAGEAYERVYLTKVINKS